MKNNFPHVFSPLTVRGMTLKNRVVMMPMGSDFAGHDGELSDEHIKYYELRARGGTGLIMVENVCVKYPEGSNGTTQLRLDKDCYIPRLFTLTEACHRQGALMGIQINHAGASAMSSRIGMRPVSASRFPSKAGGEIPRGLSKEEIESIAKDYGTAAKRAVNAYLRTNSEILILTFNLSLKNYIRDKINDVRESYPWEKFYITNYHQFIKSEANNYNLPIKGLKSYTDINFFEPVKNHIKKYKAIFIDEVQDYQTEWLEIITKYFLYEDSEFVVFGDEKQNIYRRPLDENKEPVIKTIAGNWNKSLNASKRFTSEIGKLAMKFQHHFLENKYTIDNMVVLDNPMLDFEQRNIKYANIGAKASTERIFNIYKGTCKKYCLNPADITILSGTADILREIEYSIRTQLKENTTTTFETKEEYDKSELETKSKNNFEERINTIRRYRRNHFSIKTGTVKLSSIHSFKGWESHTIFLIIEPHKSDSIQDFESVELIYTAITRAQVNLFILNIGNEKYDSFFNDNIQN